ncbi:3-deoxy-manno-octulosonate cytidylyltransferase [Flavobacterium sp. xlx-214]|uniref:3-deoxy-manno-octulosonate cytidylyltransferase n=1 Tax=unclassified Flavobacterium TaxID=196869 RepID=UPI0013D1C5D0|nr:MULTISPECIES: 3-deoxy-manno-octulosonate cytidylyltransferase [unclassified Flavobacterium]MBA5791308.1 3-deoxy-manno-octulosonate cytidylyltransferase [Flavobacterium sp. xlx-221]QMI83534.1 3-deoxy-manno-octulosonate cytidylyltransferase [Flavobacterium sp. xlx-214]
MSKLKIIAVIPARYASTRFPAKLIQDLGGKPVVVQTYLATVATQLFDEVLVATDHEIIYNLLQQHQVNVVMSSDTHESGSDRIAEVIQNVECDVIVNVQGDEPFVSKENLQSLIEVFEKDSQNAIDLASLMFEITDLEVIQNPNNVKVVIDENNKALYFSRAAIPFPRDGKSYVPYYQHIGVYAYRKQALLDFTTWQMKGLEATEKLEQLRYLEHGRTLQMVKTQHIGVGIDTKEDLDKARLLWK